MSQMKKKSHGSLWASFYFLIAEAFYYFYRLHSLSGPDQPAEFLSRKCAVTIVSALQSFWESLHLHHLFKGERADFVLHLLPPRY